MQINSHDQFFLFITNNSINIKVVFQVDPSIIINHSTDSELI